ncbi:translocase of inner mitochondrial membrane 21, transcript variant X3 [Ictidomys tridecemlineatus]|uniref:mitochondrial import inner membrane translocase subunit Tim21 isoform X2 n=1 Tax=Ictidomys tridecemlineatus TaxID=43179 RepID=UPI000680276F|nr:mitochondrial import inner membrane translocase subunit Tim21 isoform X2 [Ictidomys tridecemlineatus]KAG3293736.1 translocase of inner mitochondrial membrane 21, transcript variant X3 [Ictidomys tridecemlineatus]
MICTALRALQYAERLHRSSGKRLLLPDRGPHRAASKTQPSLRWGLREPKKTAQPRSVLGLVQKTIWTQGPSPCNAQEDRRKQVSVHRDQRAETAVSTSQKVKEAGRDFTYLVIVVIGVGITGGLFYTIFRELFSSSSPSKVVSVFGEPVRGYGEMTRRGRRQHVSFIEYVRDGLKHLRVKFYIEGSEPGKQGTVFAEVRQNPEGGDYEFQYVFVEVDSYPRRTIVIEDNRGRED